MNRRIIGILLFLLCSVGASAQRQMYNLNTGWMFRFSHQVEKSSPRPISLPHTWNKNDALSGKIDYKRGIGNYERTLYIKPEWKDKRLFLKFDGANSIANVFLDGKHIGEHRGGYSAFVFEITKYVQAGKKHQLRVRVNNGEQLDVLPLTGDFNVYGGIYRDVKLVVTHQTCISPTDYASPGVYLTQKKVTKQQAIVDARILISSANVPTEDVTVRLTVSDGNKVVTQKDQTLHAPMGDTEANIPIVLDRPHLWNGRTDPFMYQVGVELFSKGKVIDQVQQPLGLRYYQVDPERGFFLNGKHLTLKGVCRHQDRAEVGNALRIQHHEQDMDIMLEMGANAIRLAHYQQAEEIYHLADKHGMVVWAEIPFVGPGGYADKGFVDLPTLKANARQQLKELIRQNYNHPSICFWGIFNELNETGDNPTNFVAELNQLAKQEDATRYTTSATNIGGKLNDITDVFAWNRYDGWYGNSPQTLATFLDRTHAQKPQRCLGLSEYGAGASIYHQQDSLKQPKPAGYWHPENWQTYYHIANWKIIHSRPFVWGSFVWNMFDFGAAHRNEGDRPGINDKGLVTFDRSTRKDAYYFYQANWNEQKHVLYLAGRRNNIRRQAIQQIQVFSNLPKAELRVNGQSHGTLSPDEYHTILWENVRLHTGNNVITVIGKAGNKTITDQMQVVLE